MPNMNRMPQVCESRSMGRMLGVPSQWLRDELKAGKLPGVQVNDQKALFNPRATVKALANRAKGETQSRNGDPRK